MTACKRCGEPDAAAAWSAWWDRLELSVGMPADAAAPFCPVCMTGGETVAYLAGCHSARILFADRFAEVGRRIEARFGELVAAQTCEAAAS